jgi:hypothetical protein
MDRAPYDAVLARVTIRRKPPARARFIAPFADSPCRFPYQNPRAGVFYGLDVQEFVRFGP